MIELLSAIGTVVVVLLALLAVVALWYEASKVQPRPSIGRY